MAIINSHNLSLEINFMEFDDNGWIQYEVLFKINGQNMINPDHLKTRAPYWNRRPNNGFKVNEDETDGLIPLLEQVLETDEPDYWQPIEPDITLAVYPDRLFPFLPSHRVLLYEKPELREARLRRIKRKEELKQLPDDWFQLICLIDTYNFAETKGYSGNGVALHLAAKRSDVQVFLQNLKQEYGEFQAKFKEKIDTYFNQGSD